MARRPCRVLAVVETALDRLVQEGRIEARLRPDGQVGYYPTGTGDASQDCTRLGLSDSPHPPSGPLRPRPDA